MKVGAFTAIGKVRQINEDSFYIPRDIDNDIPLFIVADGMGGHNAGEIASSKAIELVVEYINKNFIDYKKKEDSLTKLLSEAILRANHNIYKKSISNSNMTGMGTTLTAVLIDNNKVYIAHVGDSRAYTVKKNHIYQLTKDHSYVEQLINNGKITREEAINHPQKNIITRAIGVEGIVEIDISVRHFEKNDKFILCTDGLTNLVSDEQILKIIQGNKSCQSTAEKLVNMADDLGGKDNITVIVIKE